MESLQDEGSLEPLFHACTNDRAKQVDDREVDDQGQPHDFAHTPEFREFDARGGATFTYEASTFHNLSQNQLARSTTGYTECTRLIECSSTDEGAFEMTVSDIRSISRDPMSCPKPTQKVTQWMRRVPLRTKTETEEHLAGLSDDQMETLLKRFGVSEFDALVNLLPWQGRGPMILLSSTRYYAGVPSIDNMTPEELFKVESTVRRYMKAAIRGKKPLEKDLEYLKAEVAKTDLTPADFISHIKSYSSALAQRLDVLGVDDLTPDIVKKFDEEPQVTPNWGCPESLLPHIKSKLSWKEHVTSGNALSRGALNVKVWSALRIKFLNFGGLHANQVPTLPEILSAMKRIEGEYWERYDAWQKRRDPTALWETLGDLTGRIGSSGGWNGMMAIAEDEYDVRPRSRLVEEPSGALMSPEEEYLARDLLRKSTPKDFTRWMGSHRTYEVDLPLNERLVGDRRVRGGHPMYWLIDKMIRACREERNAHDMGIDESKTEIRRVIFRPDSVPLMDRNGKLMYRFGTEDHPTWAMPLYNERNEAESNFQMPGYYNMTLMFWKGDRKNGYVHKMKPNDPMLAYWEDKKAPAFWSFVSEAKYLAALAVVLKVPYLETISVEREGYNEYDEQEVTEEQRVIVKWAPLPTIYPALARWMVLLSDAYNDGETNLSDVAYTEKGLALRHEVTSELSAHQRRMLDQVVALNVQQAAGFIVTVNEQTRNVIHNPDSLGVKDWPLQGDQEGSFKQWMYGKLFREVLPALQKRTLLPQHRRWNPDTRQWTYYQAGYNMRRVWRAMGFNPVTEEPKDTGDLKKMVAERFYHSHVMSPRRWTINGMPRYLPPVASWMDNPTLTGTGILGNRIARFNTMANPLVLPGLGTVFTPTSEELSAAGNNVELAIRHHVLSINEAWGAENLRRLVKLGLNWSQMKELHKREYSEYSHAVLARLFFPLEPMPSLESWSNEVPAEREQKLEYWRKLVIEAKARNVKQQERRMLGLSFDPKVTRTVMDVLKSTSEMERIGMEKLEGIIGDLAPRIGNLSSAMLKAALKELREYK